MKITHSLAIALLLATGTINIDASVKVGDLYYEILSPAEKTVKVVAPDNSGTYGKDAETATDINIPETIEIEGDTYTVTEIGSKAFYRSSITSVTIPATVETIGTSAFQLCYQTLTSVTFPEKGIKTFSEGAFASCSLAVFNRLPETTEVIGKNAFSSCNKLTDGTMPDSVKEIGYGAFGHTAITSLVVPPLITDIADYAFQYCTELTSITFHENVKSTGTQSFIYSAGPDTLVIPATLTKVGNQSFGHLTNTKKIVIEEGVESIGLSAFSSCQQLTSVSYPKSVNTTGSSIFSDNKVLTDITIADGVTEIPQSFVNGCSLITNSDFLPESVEKIGASAFACTWGLKSFTFPPKVTEIPEWLLDRSAITDLVVPEGITTIGRFAFDSCKFNNLTLPGSLVNFADGALRSFSCKNLTLSYGEPVALGSESLANWLEFENLYIDRDFYPGADSWISGTTTKSITVGPHVTKMIPTTRMTKLEAITMETETPPATVTEFEADVYTNAVLKVPASSYDAYKNHEVWGKFVNIETVGSEVPEEYLNVLGAGNSYAELMIHWGDKAVYKYSNQDYYVDKAMDNLVSAVKYSGTATAGDIISAALRDDSRFYGLKNAEGFVAYGFDTNGDNSAAVYNAGASLALTDGVAYVEGDYSASAGSSDYDHWQVNNEDGSWKIFVNGTVADESTTVASGDKIVLEYCTQDAAAASEKEYTFYLRPETQQGIWMPEELELNTKDGKMIMVPAISNICGDVQNLYGAKIGAEILDSEGNVINAYSVYYPQAANGGMYARVTVTSPVEAALRPYLNIRKVWEGETSAAVKRIYPDTDSKISTIVANPMTKISLDGVEEGDVIEIDNMMVEIIKPVFEPATPDFADIVVSIDDESVATYYQSVKAIVAHKEGNAKITIASADGTVSATYDIKVNGVDTSAPEDEFQNGVVWLNEEWFGHTSGSLNYITEEGDVFYRAYGGQNNNMAFGCTSQYGMIYADKLFVMSKQAWDGGDTRPNRSGGRLVIADAKTLKHIKSFDDLGGDGRSCVGVNPSKVYLGTVAGIRILNLDDMTLSEQNISGVEVDRMGQIGDMVKSGKYVYVTNIRKGMAIIDSDTDEVVANVVSTGIQGVAMSKDGRVWMATANSLTPFTGLEQGETITVPGSITCSSGSWRSVNLYASTKENKLFWGNGTLYGWNLDEEETPSTTPLYTYTSKEGDINYGSAYATGGYDDRTNTYMFASVPGFGISALENWLHFVNLETSEVHRMKLSEYWWFPAMPIFPDKYGAECDIAEVTMDLESEGVTFDLNEHVTDIDSHDHNINIQLMSQPETRDVPACEVKYEDNVLSIKPLALGKQNVELEFESNGKKTVHTIPVTVAINTGVDNVVISSGRIESEGDLLNIIGMEGVSFNLYTLDGKILDTFKADDNLATWRLTVGTGIYVVRGDNGYTAKIVK